MFLVIVIYYRKNRILQKECDDLSDKNKTLSGDIKVLRRDYDNLVKLYKSIIRKFNTVKKQNKMRGTHK